MRGTHPRARCLAVVVLRRAHRQAVLARAQRRDGGGAVRVAAVASWDEHEQLVQLEARLVDHRRLRRVLTGVVDAPVAEQRGQTRAGVLDGAPVVEREDARA